MNAFYIIQYKNQYIVIKKYQSELNLKFLYYFKPIFIQFYSTFIKTNNNNLTHTNSPSERKMDKLNLPNYQREFMEKGLKMTLDFVESTIKGENKVIEIKPPEKLKEEIDFKFHEEACGNEQLVELLNKILNKQTKPYHPHFHNQLFGGFDQYSVLGAMMVPAINGSVYTYEIAPCFTLMEEEVYDLCKKLLNWSNIDGIFTPGGSFANFMSITTSRYNLDPIYKTKGNNGKPLKIFTSETSHYSMKKGAHFCGIGEENVIYVKADMSGRMIPEELEKSILKEKEEGNICMLVNATMGTTVEGNIDPLKEIGKICKKHNIWFHVDAALGGALIFSPKLMIGKEEMFADVDSITIDPHKGLVVPLQLSLFLINKKEILFPANSAHADYLFHKERASYSGNLDIGDKSFQCGRVIDILKFWTYLKGNGLNGIAQQVENEHKLALYVKDYVKSRPERFILVVEDVETFNICFWYVPQHLKEEDFLTKDEFQARLSQVTVLAKKFMIEEGKMLVGYSKSQVKYYFWRTVMSNPFLIEKDVDYEMELTAQYCEKAYNEILENEKHVYEK